MNRITQIAIVIFTLLFGSCVVIIFGSDRLYSLSLSSEAGKIPTEKGIYLLEIAIKLTPGDARLYAEKYDLMGQSAKRSSVVSRQSSEDPSPFTFHPSHHSPDDLTSSRAHELKKGISSGSPSALRSAPPGDLLYEQQLQVIARCIDLCPSVAGYHFQYALNMRKVLPRMTIPATRYLLSEFKKAFELKPCSAKYRSMYEKYEERYGVGK